jgi:hypothetical protein
MLNKSFDAATFLKLNHKILIINRLEGLKLFKRFSSKKIHLFKKKSAFCIEFTFFIHKSPYMLCLG